MTDQERLIGKISRRDLAQIFARAAELSARKELKGKDLRQALMDQVMEKAKTKQPDESASASSSGRYEPGGNLGDLSRSVEDLTKTLELDPGETVPAAQPRNRTGVMGLETLEELFVREGQVRFDGYMEDIEQQIVDTFENFKAVSWEFGISAKDFETGDILGDAGTDLLESRRASRLAEARSSGRIPSMAMMEAAQTQPVVTQLDADTINVLCACGVQRQLHLPELPRLRIRCSSCRQVLYTPPSAASPTTSRIKAQLLSSGPNSGDVELIYDPHRKVYLAPSTPYVAPGDTLWLADGRSVKVEEVKAEVQGGRSLQCISVSEG